MKKRYAYIISVFLLMFVFAGCNRAVRFDRDLDRVERLLDVSPDSAWKVISAINPDEPRHIERKARYGLLYIQAQDKNNIKVENDSLISIVLNYYSGNGNIKERFLSFYYYGKMLSEKGDCVRALSYFSKAEKLQVGVYDASYIELLHKQIEELYNKERDISQVLQSQHEYLSDELEYRSQKANDEKKTAAIWIVLSVVLCGLLFFYLYEHLQRKKEDLDSCADVISELRMTLNDKNSKMGELHRELLKEHNKTLNLIGASFFDKENNPQGQRLLYREVQNIIEKFRQKKTQQEVELFVNKYCDNVMLKLREEMTDFEEDDYMQICYHIVGFSSKLVSLILGISDVNINTRKFRLKKRIESSNACHKREILQYI